MSAVRRLFRSGIVICKAHKIQKSTKEVLHSMDKEKALQHLIESGFKAYNENGVVMVDCDDRKTARKVSEELDSIDYHCSFGFKFATA